MTTPPPLSAPLAMLENAGFLIAPFPLFTRDDVRGWVAVRVGAEWADTVVLRRSDAATATRVAASALDRTDIDRRFNPTRHVTCDALGVVYEVLGWPPMPVGGPGERLTARDRADVARRNC